MTVEEKVGQMTQLTIDMVTSGDDQEVRIDPAKLEKAINKYGVGSILNVNNQALPMERWHEIISGIQTAAAKTRLKIPVIYGIDSIHGANYIQGATLFPQEIGMAATWNPALMQRAAEITAAETRAAGIPWSFSPVLDVGRDPDLAALLGNFWRRPVSRESNGYRFCSRARGRRRRQRQKRRREPEALCRLQLSAQRPRPDARLDPRTLSAGIFSAAFCSRRKSRRAHRYGQFGLGQRHSGPCQ